MTRVLTTIAAALIILFGGLPGYTQTAETGEGVKEEATESPPPKRDGKAEKNEISNAGEAQDRQFLAMVYARDDLRSNLDEIERIVDYHNGLRARVTQSIAGIPTRSNETINREIAADLDNLKKIEERLRIETDLTAKIEIVREVDEKLAFSAFNSRSLTNRVFGFSKAFRPSGGDVYIYQNERSNLDQLFQNMSVDNRVWQQKYEDALSQLDQKLREINTRTPFLDKLPPSFTGLTDAKSMEELTETQILEGMAKYKEALNASIIRTGQPEPSVQPAILSFTDALETIYRDLFTELSSARSRLTDVEKNISGQAKVLYGNEVGSDSFNYLLIVFGFVFAVIMITPLFYEKEVSINLLKAEFLLQFSTVFVLVAAIIILGIGKLIDTEQLPVLLAGISGYVLGQLGKA